MGLFDKKYCDICGEKIGLLGNRKLEDGNLCKDCARKLSPFFSERRHSTVDEIRQQLAYREENERRLADFHPDMNFGEGKKVYIDRKAGQFIVTSASNWHNANPDLIHFRQVRSVATDIHENKTEIYYQDENGNRKSYNPRRYECDYEFNVTILVDSPWFDKIELELSGGNRPNSPYTDLYRHYEAQMHTLSSVLNEGRLMSSSSGYSQGTAAGATVNFAAPKTREEEIMAEVIKDSSWKCPSCQCANSGTFTCQNCGAPVADESLLTIARNIAKAKMMMENAEAKQGNAAGMQENAAGMQENAPQSWQCPFCGSQNSGKFCENCGAGKPEARPGACPGCGYVIPGGAPVPRFCPNCGAPLSDRS